MNDKEIEEYLNVCSESDECVFLEKVIAMQKKKNKKIATDIIDYLKKDENIKSILNKNLTILSPKYFTNKDIKNFISNHATNFVFNVTPEDKLPKSAVAAIRIPSKYFNEKDIAFNPEGVYYKSYFIPLHPFLLSLS